MTETQTTYIVQEHVKERLTPESAWVSDAAWMDVSVHQNLPDARQRAARYKTPVRVIERRVITVEDVLP